jgi:hypothetical protein
MLSLAIKNIMWSDIMLSVIMLSVIMLNVVGTVWCTRAVFSQQAILFCCDSKLQL